MPRPAELPTLERRYALALGHYETAAHGKETIIGLKALSDSNAKVAARQSKYRAIMEDIARQIHDRYDPSWTAGHIKPIRASKNQTGGGLISRLAYAAMRKSGIPMTTAEIADVVAVELEVDASNSRVMKKLNVTIHNTFNARLKDGMLLRLDETPVTWAIIPMPERRASAAARILSTRAIQADALPPPKPYGTAGRC